MTGARLMALRQRPPGPQGVMPVRRFNGPHGCLSYTQRQYWLTLPPRQGDFIRDASPLTLTLESAMPRGDKSSYTDKQKRQAEHIEEGYEKQGISKATAEKRAWATVNKTTGGGKKSGSGRKT